MKRCIVNKCVALIFFILLITSLSAANLVYMDLKKDTRENVSQVVQEKSDLDGSLLNDHVSFENVSFSEDILIFNESVVTITDSSFTNDVYIHVSDNAQLVLSNVTAKADLEIVISDNATLKIADTNVTTQINLSADKQSELLIENCTLDELEIWTDDYAKGYLRNTTFRSINLFGNSTIQIMNVTGYGYWRAWGNSNLTASFAKTNGSVYFQDTSTGKLKNVTLTGFYGNFYVSDNATALIEDSQFGNMSVDIFTDSYFAKVNIFNSTFNYMSSHSEEMSFLTNVTADTIDYGWIINGVGNFTSDQVYMKYGYNLNPNIIVNNSTVNSFTQNTYIRIDGYTFDFYDSGPFSRVHCYNTKIFVENSSFFDIILDNSSISIYDSSALTLSSTIGSSCLNKTSVGEMHAYSNQLTAINESVIYNCYLTNTTASFVSTPVVNLSAENSTIILKNTTETTSSKAYEITYSELTLNNCILTSLGITVNLSDFYALNWTSSGSIDFYNSTGLIGNSTLNNFRISLHNSTAHTFDSFFSSGGQAYVELFDNTEFYDVNSTLNTIYLSGPDAYFRLENDSCYFISYPDDSTASITGLIRNATIDILRVASSYYTPGKQRIMIENSKITELFYTAFVSVGTVDIFNNEISMTGVYNTSVELDSQTEVTTKSLRHLNAEDCSITVENSTNVLSIFANKTNFVAKNSSIYDVWLYSTNYTIINTTFSYLLLDYPFWSTEENFLAKHPSNGTLFNVSIDYCFIFGGEAWLTNVTINYDFSVWFGKAYLENSTIDSLMQMFYFTHDGNITDNVPYGYSDQTVIWGENNIVTYRNYSAPVVYNGSLDISNSFIDTIFVYNTSSVFFNESRVFGVHAYDNASLTSESSEFSYELVLKDYAQGSFHESTIYNLTLEDYSFLTLNECTISFSNYRKFQVLDNASLTIINSTMNVFSSDWVGTIQDNGYAEIKDTLISTSWSMDGILKMRDNSSALFDNVTFSISTTTEYGFELMNSSQLTILNSEITNSFKYHIGDFYNASQVFVNNTVFSGNALYNLFFMYSDSYFEAFNTESFGLVLLNSSNAFAYNCDVVAVFSSDKSHFDITSPLFYNTSSIITMLGHSIGCITNYSVKLIQMEDLAELVLMNVYANYTGPDMGIYVGKSSKLEGDQAKLIAKNVTANSINTYFALNVTDMGYINLTDSNVDNIESKMSLYHYGLAVINGNDYTYDDTVDAFNHTLLHKTNVTKKEYALNIGEFVNASISNASFTYVRIAIEVDTEAPIISTTSKSEIFEKGMLVPDMTWNVTDENPDFYEIKQNETVTKSGSYKSGETLRFNVSSLDPGFWELTFIAYDRAGHSTSVKLNATVYPSEKPVFVTTPPSYYNMTEGSTGNVLNWTATDRFPANYEIFVNGTLKASGNWSNNVEITYNIDYLGVGNYSVKIIIYDQVGNSAENVMTVVVVAETVPPPGPGPGPGPEPGPNFLIIYIVISIGIAVILITAVIIYKKRKKHT